MSYTKEAPAATPTPAQTAPVMREDAKVYNPYSRSVPRPGADPSATTVGQLNKGGEGTAEAPAGTEESVKLTPQVAALARKEQQFRKQQQALKAREAELEAKSAKLAKLEAMEAKLAQKDYSGLDGVVDYNEFSQYQVNKLNSSDPQQAALKALEDKVNGVEKAYQDSVTKQFEAAVSERRTAVSQLVDSSADKFPSIAKLKQQEAVVQHILDTWENDSLELSVEQATQEVEEHLRDRAKHWASILETQSSSEPEKKNLPPLKQGLKTITNQVTAGDLKRPAKPYSQMTDQERWAEARRRAEDRLKQG